MSAMSATEAKNRFGELLELARKEPVLIQKNGRDVSVILSIEDYRKLVSESLAPRVNPLVAQAHAESVKRWGKVYEALAK